MAVRLREVTDSTAGVAVRDRQFMTTRLMHLFLSRALVLFTFWVHSIRAKLLLAGSKTIINSFRDSDKKTQTQIYGCKYRRADATA